MELGTLLPWAISAAIPRPCANTRRRRKRSATTLSRRPTMCSASTRRAAPEAGTATRRDCSTTRSCCSAISPAARTKLGFSTGVLILPQRQTVLVAKQAACLDVLCGGRFRLGIGVGWNEVEFIGLNENFHNRGRRSEEQVQVMQALWAEPHVTFKGRWHTIEDAGINPRPASGKVPVWFGGHHERTLQRIAKWGDGWMPNAYPPGPERARRLRQAAPADRGGRPRSGADRHRGVGVDGHRQRSRLGRGSAVLESRPAPRISA